jgi:hypothetical protein
VIGRSGFDFRQAARKLERGQIIESAAKKRFQLANYRGWRVQERSEQLRQGERG